MGNPWNFPFAVAACKCLGVSCPKLAHGSVGSQMRTGAFWGPGRVTLSRLTRLTESDSIGSAKVTKYDVDVGPFLCPFSLPQRRSGSHLRRFNGRFFEGPLVSLFVKAARSRFVVFSCFLPDRFGGG